MFLMQSAKQQLFPLIRKKSLKCSLRIFSFYSILLKSVQENGAYRFRFVLTLWLPAAVKVTESGVKMVKVNDASIRTAGQKLVISA